MEMGGRLRWEGRVGGKPHRSLPSHNPILKIIEGIVEYTQEERLGGTVSVKGLGGPRGLKNNTDYSHCPWLPFKTAW